MNHRKQRTDMHFREHNSKRFFIDWYDIEYWKWHNFWHFDSFIASVINWTRSSMMSLHVSEHTDLRRKWLDAWTYGCRNNLQIIQMKLMLYLILFLVQLDYRVFQDFSSNLIQYKLYWLSVTDMIYHIQ